MGKKIIANTVVRITGDISDIKRNLAELNVTTKRTAQGFNQFGNALKGLVGITAIFQGLKYGITQIAELEKTMRRVALISGGAEEELTKLAKTLGGSTVFTANQAGEAMQFLAQAGFDAQQIMKATPGVLDLAAAAMLDLGMAADIASNILSAYGLEAREMNRVNDILVTTTNNANTNVEQFAEAFKVVGPIAKAAGISLEEVAASIGVLGDAGIQGSLAGTQIKTIIAAFISPSAKASKTLNKLGVSTKNTDGSLRSLSEVFTDLHKTGLSAADSFQIFDKRAASGAVVFAGAAEKLGILKEQVKESGVAAEQARKQLDTLSGAWTRLGSAVDGAIQQTSGSKGWLKGLTSELAEFTLWLTGQGRPHRSIAELNTLIAELQTKLNNTSKLDVFTIALGGAGRMRTELANLKHDLYLAEEAEKATALEAEALAKAQKEVFNIYLSGSMEKVVSMLDIWKKRIEELRSKPLNILSESEIKRHEKLIQLLNQQVAADPQGYFSPTTGTNEETTKASTFNGAINPQGNLDLSYHEAFDEITQKQTTHLQELAIAMSDVISLNDEWQEKIKATTVDLENNGVNIEFVVEQFSKLGSAALASAIAQKRSAKEVAHVLIGTLQAQVTASIIASIWKDGPPSLIAKTALSFGAAAVSGALFAGLDSFASGGVVPYGSPLQLVGEQGPELVSMPGGSRVFNNNQTNNMLGGAYSGKINIGKFEIEGDKIRGVIENENKKVTTFG